MNLAEWKVAGGDDGDAFAFHPCGATVDGETVLDLVTAIETHECTGARPPSVPRCGACSRGDCDLCSGSTTFRGPCRCDHSTRP